MPRPKNMELAHGKVLPGDWVVFKYRDTFNEEATWYDVEGTVRQSGPGQVAVGANVVQWTDLRCPKSVIITEIWRAKKPKVVIPTKLGSLVQRKYGNRVEFFMLGTDEHEHGLAESRYREAHSAESVQISFDQYPEAWCIVREGAI